MKDSLMDALYLDNAATSYPKPERTIEAMIHYHRHVGGSPGRSGHGLSIDAGRVVFEAREILAKLFHIDDPLRLVFTKNATEAINIVLMGLLRPGDHVITTAMEHNAVMRPLRFLESRGVELSVVPCSPLGELDPAHINAAFQRNTRLVILSHASNVTGSVMPIREIGAIIRDREDVLFCVDAAQTAGALPIDIEDMAIDLLAFTGHKSLYGPQGTGGLHIRKGLDTEILPLMRGGTGSRSEFEEQPEFMPDKYECGTPNTIGLAGLGAGAAYILEQGQAVIQEKEKKLMDRFLDGLTGLGSKRIILYGSRKAAEHIPVISFNINGITPSDAALFFEEHWGIMCRPGLHCAPAAHRTIGTFPEGTVRFSFGYFHSEEDIDRAVRAVEDLLARGFA